MKLWASTTSPFVRKVRVVIIEKNLQDQIDIEMIKTSALDSHKELMKQNPLAKLPCLVLDDETSIFDSRVICRYLDDLGKGMQLHPSGHNRHETLIALCDGILECGVAMLYESLIRPEDKRYEPWIEAQWQKAKRALEFANKEYMDILEHFNMGSIGMFVALEYLDFRFDERNWRQFAPELAIWYENIKLHESFVQTKPVIS